MRIGIDAKWYVSGPPGGHAYVRGAVDALLRADTADEYTVLLGPGDDPERFPFRGPRIRAMRLGGRRSPLRARFFLPRAARRARLDVLWTHSFLPPAPCPRVLHVYDAIFASHPRMFSPVERFFMRGIASGARNAQGVVTISRHAAAEITRLWGVPADRITVAPPGVPAWCREAPCPDEQRSARAGLELDGPYIVSLSRVDRRKNIPVIVEALSLLARRDVALVVAGPAGNDSPAVSRMARRRGLDERVRVTGRLAPAVLRAVLDSARALVYVPEAEGFGLPALEAMARGVPVVASDAASLPEVVGDAGMLVPPGDAHALAGALDRILDDRDHREQRIAAGLERAKRFRWEDTAARLLEAFERAASSG